MSETEQKTKITLQKTLIENWIERLTFLPWIVDVFVLPLLLIAIHLLGHYLAGFPSELNSRFWRELFLIPTLVLYLMITRPFINNLFKKAIASFQQVLVVNQTEFELMVTKSVFFNPKLELFSFFCGAVLGCLVFRPWRLGAPFFPYLFLGDSLLFGLFAWWIYISSESAKFFTLMFKRPVKFNILQSKFLEPVAQWSLGVTVVFMGLATIGALFISTSDLFNVKYIVCYGTALLISVCIFFLGMRDTHQFIVKMKQQELEKLHQGFEATYQKFLEGLTHGGTPETPNEAAQISTFFLCEKRIREIPDWPFTSTILWEFFFTLLIPSLLALL